MEWNFAARAARGTGAAPYKMPKTFFKRMTSRQSSSSRSSLKLALSKSMLLRESCCRRG